MKQVYFYQAEHVGPEFKITAAFQAMLDFYLAIQFFMFGNGPAQTAGYPLSVEDKEIALEHMS